MTQALITSIARIAKINITYKRDPIHNGDSGLLVEDFSPLFNRDVVDNEMDEYSKD